MKKRIRIAGMILSHVGLLLSVLYLIFFAVCTVKASPVSDSEINAAESDLYLKQAMSDRDFSLFTVGKLCRRIRIPIAKMY